jgi:dipeptidyl aminopeptidase/acylaminoacyl peptidase
MSPFMNANKMKTPLLLVHGKPIIILEHSLYKRTLFPSIKRLRTPVRMVILPKESTMPAKENILHLLWEQDQFLENI